MQGNATHDGSCRNIVVTATCPPQMRKRDVWRIDQFHLQKKIGSGYASTVYLATCRTTGFSVALKLYHKNKLSELNHFQVNREIRIHSGLEHKNIVQLWAAFEDQYGIYLVTEYAGKGDVFTDVERRGGQMSEGDAVRQVIHPFLMALNYLHTNNIIHRDIKPENLLLTATGVLKVGDFGLSINIQQERPVTRVGTLDYMAPEVVVCPDKHKPMDHKAMTNLYYSCVVDTWAVGVLAYELLVGRPPFDRGQKKATISEILTGEPVIPATLSENAAHFIRWALTKDRQKRPSALQLAEHPWVAGHMKQPMVKLRGLLGRTESFVEPRALLSSHEQRYSNSPSEVVHNLQVQNVQQSGRMLGHSHSMSAAEGMRWRDVALFESLGPEAAFGQPKRKSEGHEDLPSSRRASLAAAASAAGLSSPNSPLAQARSSSGSLARGTSGLSPAELAELSSLQRSSSSFSKAISREELLASLQSPSGQRGPVRSNSLTSRPCAPAPVPPMQRGVYMRGTIHKSQSMVDKGRVSGQPSPLQRQTSASSQVASALAASAELERVVIDDLADVRTSPDTSTSSPASDEHRLRAQRPPQLFAHHYGGEPSSPVPSSSAYMRNFKSVPMLPSRLSSSFTSTASPASAATGSASSASGSEHVSPTHSRMTPSDPDGTAALPGPATVIPEASETPEMVTPDSASLTSGVMDMDQSLEDDSSAASKQSSLLKNMLGSFKKVFS